MQILRKYVLPLLFLVVTACSSGVSYEQAKHGDYETRKKYVQQFNRNLPPYVRDVVYLRRGDFYYDEVSTEDLKTQIGYMVTYPYSDDGKLLLYKEDHFKVLLENENADIRSDIAILPEAFDLWKEADFGNSIEHEIMHADQFSPPVAWFIDEYLQREREGRPLPSFILLDLLSEIDAILHQMSLSTEENSSEFILDANVKYFGYYMTICKIQEEDVGIARKALFLYSTDLLTREYNGTRILKQDDSGFYVNLSHMERELKEIFRLSNRPEEEINVITNALTERCYLPQGTFSYTK